VFVIDHAWRKLVVFSYILGNEMRTPNCFGIQNRLGLTVQ
jgi:hypothetical protein